MTLTSACMASVERTQAADVADTIDDDRWLRAADRVGMCVLLSFESAEAVHAGERLSEVLRSIGTNVVAYTDLAAASADGRLATPEALATLNDSRWRQPSRRAEMCETLAGLAHPERTGLVAAR
jgi:hypothetical protein